MYVSWPCATDQWSLKTLYMLGIRYWTLISLTTFSFWNITIKCLTKPEQFCISFIIKQQTRKTFLIRFIKKKLVASFQSSGRCHQFCLGSPLCSQQFSPVSFCISTEFSSYKWVIRCVNGQPLREFSNFSLMSHFSHTYKYISHNLWFIQTNFVQEKLNLTHTTTELSMRSL